MISIGGLVTLAVGAVLIIQWSTSREILSELGGQVVLRNLSIIEQGVQDHLHPARDQVDFLAELIESGEYDLADPTRLTDLMIGALAAVPQISVLIVSDASLQALLLRRDPTTTYHRVEYGDFTEDPGHVELEAELQQARGSYWGALVYDTEKETTLINVRRPLFRDGVFLGFVAAAVSTEELSKYLNDVGELFQSRIFVLYGPDAVLAHPDLKAGHAHRSEQNPAVPIGVFGDPVLDRIHRRVDSDLVRLLERSGNVEIHGVDVQGTRYYVLERELSGYGPTPIIIGAYRKEEEVDGPIHLLYVSGLIGLAAFVLALICAIVLSRRIALPIRRVSSVAAKVGTLDFKEVDTLKPSMITEINDLASAFNRMLGGLRSFETYVPRSLVARLVREGLGSSVQSEERELTIMFTDVAGFTAMSEDMDAKSVATFLNHHLTILSDCVEAAGGTVDKYIGDAVMAFWGAPEKIANSAASACQAAVAMARAIAEDNRQRAEAGEQPVRVRIGIHTGPLVVGNIGAPSRINYTVVGDTVNTAQRLEALGKEVDPEGEVIILVTAATKERLSDDYVLAPAGQYQVKGKSEPIDIYKLNWASEES